MRFYIKDNVCTPYKLILNRINNYLIANGCYAVSSGADADIFIVGCCGAFHSLENEALSLIKEAKTTNAELIVFGCLTSVAPEKVKALKPHRIVSAPDWESLEDLVEKPVVQLHEIAPTSEFRSQEEYRLYDPGKKFVLIQTGCSSYCPYCPHKLGIGELKSIKREEILSQIKDLTDNGAHTIVLHGNDTGSYGTDIGTTYPKLLKDVLKICPNLHLTQINADWFYRYREELSTILFNEKIRELQVLIQTTSNRLLKLMNRMPIVKELFVDLKKVRDAREDVIFRTDIIIGYPTSTLEEEKDTLQFVAELFDEVAVHGFERFQHAPIEKMGVPFFSEEEIESRLKYAIDFLKSYPNILVHRGGQVYQTLIDIERPKDQMRLQKVNEQY